MLESHARRLKDAPHGPGPVVYWMHRDQRARDNFGLLYAQRLALTAKRPLAVVFALSPGFLGAGLRQYAFMLKGLAEAEAILASLRIPFFLLCGQPPAEVLAFIRQHRAMALVTDFDPLRLKRAWVAAVTADAPCPVASVDSRNVVPCLVASDRKEYMARTIRPKIQRLLPGFLVEPPALLDHPVPWPGGHPENDFAAALARIQADPTVAEVSWCRPGESAAREMLDTFAAERLPRYAAGRNDPNAQATSNLSPYLHFGQISPLRVALAVAGSAAPLDCREAFLEELIVRRELAENFCWFNPDYDTPDGFPDWARRTLEKHAADRREYLYSLAELDAGRTHDPLWNAAQAEMVVTGTMHGYLRMYWAKKILEWSESPEAAQSAAIALNDRYQLDGRDVNGYTGIAWSMGGVHDRPWAERPIFGLVRYMSFGGAKSKFDLAAYIARQLGPGAVPPALRRRTRAPEA